MLFNIVLPLKYRYLRIQLKALRFVVEELQRSKNWIRRMLFPEETDGKAQTQLRRVPYRRGLLNAKVNYEQLQAINSACENEYGSVPFLISGPPGTGKTLTMVELALQLLNTTMITHLIVCAPSDQAADTLALRLAQWLNPGQMLRLNGPGRPDNEVPKQLLSYCYREEEMFYLPPVRQLMTYNIVVTTTRDAAILAEARLTNIDIHHIERSILTNFHPEATTTTPPLHWGALLIDEAAQATEVDALPALSVIMPPATWPHTLPQPQFIMAGDENQLGPRTASRNTAFSTSLFARLFSRRIYASHPLSRSNLKPSQEPPVMSAALLPMIYPPFTNLTRNYRSHPSILSVPSSLFYNDTLIPEISSALTPLQQSPLWRGRKWPVLYIPHNGHDELERDGGGWYNHSEAREACDLAQRLVSEGHVAQSDIAIMSPFAAQVKRMRTMIRATDYGDGAGLWDVNIGPMEAFQGLESRVVILCITRTRDLFLPLDEERGLGLVGKDMRRKVNVALTRAKEALIVIGSEKVLAKDECWMAWMAFCWRNGLVVGEPWSDKMVETFRKYKAGVLEKALVVKEERKLDTGKTLGGKARMLGGLGMSEEDEMWAMGLRDVIEEIEAEAEAEDADTDAYDDGDGDGDGSDEEGDGETEIDTEQVDAVAEDDEGEVRDQGRAWRSLKDIRFGQL
ncbi:P-loop containing nucleoside triphosphate hydrolase protein [Lophiostoma macrostomum CBS 122681]|uniref:P-loop containing nucleoside triphosphate hydrolase protein n=1 Tax=Lophiostoma macrostomum CBS 122681 TaxID=1314788 RepID=A0A6A6SQM5_9PLEO|nr:P-loop containing nucleoside triphosphate hydrolase protein [Lophiostoma macrostomum CBS 122681]